MKKYAVPTAIPLCSDGERLLRVPDAGIVLSADGVRCGGGLMSPVEHDTLPSSGG